MGKMKNIKDYLDISEDRLNEITKMAERSIMKSFDSLLTNIRIGNLEKGYAKFSEDSGKTVMEDISNLKTVTEGVVYGLASQTYSDIVSNELASLETPEGIIRLLAMR
jgi:hypothetical protein